MVDLEYAHKFSILISAIAYFINLNKKLRSR
jgi:hypothetical protein